MDRAQDAVFACHVVRFGRDRPERRPSQNELPLGRADEVDEVGVAVGELLDFDRLAQVSGEAGAVDLFAGPNRGGQETMITEGGA